MPDRPWQPARRCGLPCSWAAAGRRDHAPLDDAWFVAAALVAVAADPFSALDEGDPRNAQNSCGRLKTARTIGRGSKLGDRALQLEDAMGDTLVLVEGHAASHLASARSDPAGILEMGAELGRISTPKISVGMARVAHAFGMSTIPLMRPSTGAVPKMAYA